MKLIFGGTGGSGGGATTSGIHCSIILDGDFEIGGLCASDNIQECNNYAFNLCASYTNNNLASSCGVGQCS